MASLWQEREKQLLALRERAKRGGGEARMNKQRAAGKLTARERLTLLFDPDTFVEIGELVESRIDDFGMADGLRVFRGFHGHRRHAGRISFPENLPHHGYGDRHEMPVCAHQRQRRRAH